MPYSFNSTDAQVEDLLRYLPEGARKKVRQQLKEKDEKEDRAWEKVVEAKTEAKKNPPSKDARWTKLKGSPQETSLVKDGEVLGILYEYNGGWNYKFSGEEPDDSGSAWQDTLPHAKKTFCQMIDTLALESATAHAYAVEMEKK